MYISTEKHVYHTHVCMGQNVGKDGIDTYVIVVRQCLKENSVPRVSDVITYCWYIRITNLAKFMYYKYMIIYNN